MHKRRYADLSFGQVHYRIAGAGQPLLLLHQSPRTSAEHIPLMHELADDFLVIAPDTPGNGQSDPLLHEAPRMGDYAAALIEFLDVLKLDEVLIYGFHTGASIATATAALHPARVRFAIANGLSILRGDFKQDILKNYSPAFYPKEDGSHLNWLWDRFQKQAEFFPWYQQDEEHRLNIPPYSAEKCQGMVEDFLLAGNDYIAPYTAAFEFDPVADDLLPSDNLLVLVAEKDPLVTCMQYLPSAQASVIAPNHDAGLDIAKSKLRSFL